MQPIITLLLKNIHHVQMLNTSKIVSLNKSLIKFCYRNVYKLLQLNNNKISNQHDQCKILL